MISIGNNYYQTDSIAQKSYGNYNYLGLHSCIFSKSRSKCPENPYYSGNLKINYKGFVGYSSGTPTSCIVKDRNLKSDEECIMETYLKGEREIRKLISFSSISWGINCNYQKNCGEIRTSYEQTHPEYVKAKEQYLKKYGDIIVKHSSYIYDKMKEWDDKHPLNPMGMDGLAHDAFRANYQRKIEKDYRAQNPEYDEYMKLYEKVEGSVNPEKRILGFFRKILEFFTS